HERAHRHIELEIGASMAGAVRTLPVVAARCAELRVEAVVDQRVRVRVGDDENRSAVAAVAAARAAAGHELLATEGETAASAMAGRDVNVDFVDEHQWLVPGGWCLVLVTGNQRLSATSHQPQVTGIIPLAGC